MNVHEEVARAYTQAVQNPATGCCAEPKGVAAKTAGYKAEDLAALPEGAVANAFGCGNRRAFSEVKEGDVVLDLGSGAGIDLLIAARRVGPHGRVIGVDMTDAMLERARANVAQAGVDNVEVRKGLIEQLPVEDGSVDWVISNCVINLSPDKPRVFAEIARVLKPGGQMRVSDMVVEGLPDFLRNDRKLYSSCVAGAIPEEAYLDGLRRAGLEEVRVLERVVYDRDYLRTFVESELPVELTGCCRPNAETIAEAMAGKVASIRVGARKA